MSTNEYTLRSHIVVDHDERSGEVILVDGQTGAMWASNESGAALVLHLQTGASVEALAECLSNSFDVADAVARRDSAALVDQLSGMGFLESRAGKSTAARSKEARRSQAA